MSHKIKFLSLNKAELEYEVGIRGETVELTVTGLRRQITKLAVVWPSEEILVSHLEPADDLKQVSALLSKVAESIKSLNLSYDLNLYLRTENNLNHLHHRLNRISASTKEDLATYKKSVASLDAYFKELLSMNEENDKHSNSDAEPSGKFSLQNISSESPGNITVSCDRGVSADLAKIKYNGVTCVRSFIQKIKEFQTSRGISDSKLMRYATEIFTENALHWFRSIQTTCDSWSQVLQLLKADFDISDFDYRFITEIKQRTQGEKETITVYFAIMQGMFSRLSSPLSEDDKLEILLHNIRPCYASVIVCNSNITSVSALKQVCKEYENIQSRLSHFKEPPAASNTTLAPDFAYKQYNNINKPQPQTYNNKFKSQMHVVSVNNKKEQYCYRCRKNDHSLLTCHSKQIVCFKCGKAGVKLPNCPDCNIKKSSNSNHSKNV